MKTKELRYKLWDLDDDSIDSFNMVIEVNGERKDLEIFYIDKENKEIILKDGEDYCCSL